MKTGKILFLFLFLITENYVNAQIFTDSIQFGGDKSIPSRVILSTRQKTALTQRTKSLDKVAESKVILEQALSLDENTTAVLQGRNTDFNNNEHVSFHQYYKGVKVENTRSIVHYKNGEANSVNGNFRTVGNLSVKSQLSEPEALQYALSHIGAQKYMWEDEANEKWIKAEQEDSLATFYPKGELVIYFNKEDTPVLTYKFDIYAGNPLSRNYIYVNAANGKIEGTAALIHRVSGTAATRYSGTRTIETQLNNGVYRLNDVSRGQGIRTYNMSGQTTYANIDYIDNDNNWTAAEWNNTNRDNAALDAHWGAIQVYDYFKIQHNRDSYNNQNAPLLNYVNTNLPVVVDSRYNNSDNAFWDGTRMIYGMGTAWEPLTTLDIVAHEITHGITQATAGLVYANESGALNESFSDIFAACIENTYKPNATNNWLCGEEIASGGLRSMSNPLSKNQPDTYKGANWYPSVTNPNENNDYGGVHTNSGVLNYWFYLLANGSSGTSINGVTIQGIGIEKAAQIAYETLVNRLTPTSDYYDVAEKSLQATLELYCSDEVSEVSNNGAVFSSSGCGSGWIGATVQINGISYVLPRKNINVSYSASLSGTYTQAGSTRTLQSLNYIGYTGGTVTVTFPAISGVSYSWSGAITGTGNTKTYTPASTQGFSITVTRTIPECSTQSATYTFSVTYNIGGCITSYNPNTGTAEINFDRITGLQELKQTYLVRLIDIYGRTVKESRSQGNTVEWNLSALQNSIYFVRIYDQNNHIVKTEKIIKRN